MLHYPSIFRCSRAANSLIGDGILTKFKLTQAFIVLFLICKNEYDLFKNWKTLVKVLVTKFLPFLRHSRAAHPSFYGWPCYRQEWRRSNKKWGNQSGQNIIHQFLRCSRAANSIIGDWTLTEIKLIQAFIVVLLSEDQFKI